MNIHRQPGHVPAATARCRRSALTVLLALGGTVVSLALGGCGGTSNSGALTEVDGVRVKSTIDRPGLYDVDINGIDCDVTIGEGNTLQRLLITGVGNTVRIPASAKVERIEFTGSKNTVFVPKGFKTQVDGVGSNNHVKEV
ncbi:MAG: hypothetical protein CFE41_19425 [Burkholderiales bacterium PBB2]|nr:MAG: hypothetical protein CFE41_19425 [Burkholderiales bacterium PBB2]